MSFEAITAINEAEASARQMKADALASAKAAEADKQNIFHTISPLLC